MSHPFWMDMLVSTAVATGPTTVQTAQTLPCTILTIFGNPFLQVRTHAHPPSLSSKILDYIDASSTLAERGVSSSPTQVLLCECLCL